MPTPVGRRWNCPPTFQSEDGGLPLAAGDMDRTSSVIPDDSYISAALQSKVVAADAGGRKRALEALYSPVGLLAGEGRQL